MIVSRSFVVPPYDNVLLQFIILTGKTTIKEVDKINKLYPLLSITKSTYACVHKAYNERRKEKILVIVFNVATTTPITHGVITHEMNHVKNMVFETIGYEPDLENDEAESYYLNYLVDTAYKYLEDKKLLNKIKTRKNEQYNP